MTEMVTLRLIFYGLMAFVPNDSSPTSLQVMLVDGRGHHYASDGCRLPSHTPALYVSAAGCFEEESTHGGHGHRGASSKCALSSAVPRPVEDEQISGSWPLDSETLSVEVETAGGRRQRKLVLQRTENAVSVLPASREEGLDLSWMPQFPGPVAQSCLGTGDDCPVAARFRINDGEVTSCRLFERPEGNDLTAEPASLIGFNETKVPAFVFRPLGTPAKAALQSSPARAMSTAVLVTQKIPRGAKVRIGSTRFSDTCRGGRPYRSIVLEAGDSSTIDVWVTNVPARHDMEDTGDICDNGDVDRHFELYYNLLAERVPFAQRAVPHLVENRSVSSEEVQPSSDKGCRFLRFLEDDGRVPGEWRACGNVWVNSTGSGS